MDIDIYIYKERVASNIYIRLNIYNLKIKTVKKPLYPLLILVVVRLYLTPTVLRAFYAGLYNPVNILEALYHTISLITILVVRVEVLI